MVDISYILCSYLFSLIPNSYGLLSPKVHRLILRKSTSDANFNLGCRLFAKVPDVDTSDDKDSGSSSSGSDSSSRGIQITIPQRFPESLSPLHKNPYPSALHTIHISQVLSPSQASTCLNLARNYAAETECWSRKDTERHSAYSTADFPIEDCSEMQSYLDEIDFESRIFEQLGDLFGVEKNDLEFLDLFCAHYQGGESRKRDSKLEDGDDDGNDDDIGTSEVIMDRLAPHRDGTLLSFTIVLNSPDDYEGGGTAFPALSDVENTDDGVLTDGVLKVRSPGEAVLHCGKILHGAHVVESGERTTITGFVDVFLGVRQGVLSEACKNWGRMDAAKRRLERQTQKLAAVAASSSSPSPSLSKGWILGNSDLLGNTESKSESVGRSHVKGFIPIFPSVEKRGNEEYQQGQNLITEDLLLRDIFLSGDEEEEQHPSEKFDLTEFGDITIL